MKLLKAQTELLASALNSERGAMVCPFKDDIVFAIPDHASMGYFIPKDKLMVKCTELSNMPFKERELDIIQEDNRLMETNVETNVELKHETVKQQTFRHFVFANDPTGDGVWCNAKFLKNFEHYTLYQDHSNKRGLLLVVEGENKTLAGIIMPYNIKNQNIKNN